MDVSRYFCRYFSLIKSPYQFLGIALRYNLGDFTSNYVFSVLGSNQYISSIVHNKNTTFFVTEGGNVYRTNNDPFNNVFDSVYVNCSLFACGAGVIPMTTIVSDGKTAIIGARGSVSRVIKMQLYGNTGFWREK